MPEITLVVGTRPELIKVAPVVKSLQSTNVDYQVLNTAQHKELLEPYWEIFGIQPDVVMDVMRPGQNLSALTSRAISEIQTYLDNCQSKPQIILAQGDTTTVMATAIVSFYNKIPFVHLEAGLRSFDFENPFPEEFNRRVAAIPATIHFAPTKKAKENLLKEGIPEGKIQVVGNTVIDSLEIITVSSAFKNSAYRLDTLNSIPKKSSVLITCHRRENQGENLEKIIAAVDYLSKKYSSLNFIWSIHPNPKVKEVVEKSNLQYLKNVFLLPPLDYLDLLKLLNNSRVVITDSGGIQEEAPSFGVPVIVLRTKTERPEGVEKGMASLVGADYDKILSAFESAIKQPKSDVLNNPYGDGKASKRIIQSLQAMLQLLPQD